MNKGGRGGTGRGGCLLGGGGVALVAGTYSIDVLEIFATMDELVNCRI